MTKWTTKSHLVTFGSIGLVIWMPMAIHNWEYGQNTAGMLNLGAPLASNWFCPPPMCQCLRISRISCFYV
jgi:hypothetical protein